MKSKSPTELFGDRVAPNGNLMRDNFSDWFAGSKVVGIVGNPLILYHGTNADFAEFDPTRAGHNFNMGEVGVFFTDSPSEASLYA